MLHRKHIVGFGGSCLVTFPGDEAEASRLLQLAQSELHRLEAKFSAYSPTSVVTQLNSGSGSPDSHTIDAETIHLFELVSTLWKESKHIFDPTAHCLSQYYQGGSLSANAGELTNAISVVGWDAVEVSGDRARLLRKGASINLDGCVRAYALDSIRRKLKQHGVLNASLELESDAVTIGKQPDGSNWLIGIRQPRGGRTAINRVKLNDMSIATSGNIAHTITYQDELYGRMLSPVDGYPVPGLLQVGVIANTCLDAYCAATLARLKTEPAGLAWLDRLGLPWMAITRDMECHGPLSQQQS